MTDPIPIHCAHTRIAGLASLVPNPRNPNRHPEPQIALLAKIIRHQGWRNPITVSKRSGFIVAGHGRLEAAKLLKAETAPVDDQEFATEADEWAHLLADNRLAELAETDGAALKDLLLELDTGAFDMDLTGFDARELERVINWYPEAEARDAEPQIDKAEELNQKWGAKLGDVWTIGKHRLLCGDSIATRESALVDKCSTLVFDPEWDQSPHLPTNHFQNILAFTDSQRAGDSIKQFGSPAWIFVWDCGSCWFTPSRPLKKCKLCLWFGDVTKYKMDGAHYGDAGEQRVVSNTRGRYIFTPDPRGKHLADVFSRPITTEHAEAEHAHSKPLDWLRLLIGNCTAGDVYDPFLGSGTTMVAAENLGRTCYGIEIHPPYCAVILQRMQSAFPKLLIERQPEV